MGQESEPVSGPLDGRQDHSLEELRTTTSHSHAGISIAGHNACLLVVRDGQGGDDADDACSNNTYMSRDQGAELNGFAAFKVNLVE